MSAIPRPPAAGESTEPAVPQVIERGRHAVVTEAVATWALRRRRVIGDLSPGNAALLQSILGRLEFTEQSAHYRDNAVRPRPTVLKLMRLLQTSNGELLCVDRVSTEVYGRPVTMRALRQTAFRTSRQLENLDCPAVVHCQAGYVFVRPRVRIFERHTVSHF